MTIDRALLETSYREALTAYVKQKAHEDLLEDALEIGRSAVSEGCSLMDLLTVHHSLVPTMLMRSTQTAEMKRRLARADEFLSQVAAPFEMTHRGWREMTQRLRAANEILEHRVAERTAAHLKSVERLDRAQRIAGIGSWEIDIATSLEIWSKQMYSLHGLPTGAAHSVHDGMAACIHEADRARYDVWMRRLKAGDEMGPIEYRVQRSDGDLRTVGAEAEPVRDASGAVRHDRRYPAGPDGKEGLGGAPAGPAGGAFPCRPAERHGPDGLRACP